VCDELKFLGQIRCRSLPSFVVSELPTLNYERRARRDPVPLVARWFFGIGLFLLVEPLARAFLFDTYRFNLLCFLVLILASYLAKASRRAYRIAPIVSWVLLAVSILVLLMSVLVALQRLNEILPIHWPPTRLQMRLVWDTAVGFVYFFMSIVTLRLLYRPDVVERFMTSPQRHIVHWNQVVDDTKDNHKTDA
jgi:hypothetical protein